MADSSSSSCRGGRSGAGAGRSSRTSKRQAKAKLAAASSSSSAASHHHDDADHDIPPPPPKPHFQTLPEVVHDAIAAYLRSSIGYDFHRVMEISPWGMRVYGGRIMDVSLSERERTPGDYDYTIGLSFMKRRPGVVYITAGMFDVLAEAMKRGYCPKLEEIYLEGFGAVSQSRGAAALCGALAEGACPNIHTLHAQMYGDTVAFVEALGDALRSRAKTSRGCRPLRKLSTSAPVDPGPFLSSGMCESLEELQVYSLEGMPQEGVAEWLLRTRATHLRSFELSHMSALVVGALASPGTAPRLQELKATEIDDAYTIHHLSGAIRRQGAWPALTAMELSPASPGATALMPPLIDALRLSVPQLKSLRVEGDVPEQGLWTLLKAVRDGSWPHLEELYLDSLSGGLAHDVAMGLSIALDDDAPCSSSLRRLDIGNCNITPDGLRELSKSMGRGKLPNLEYLNLGQNGGLGDKGVVSLSLAMAAGALPHLKNLGLSNVGMGEVGLRALTQALGDYGACPKLQEVHIWGVQGMDKGAKWRLVACMDKERGPLGKVIVWM